MRRARTYDRVGIEMKIQKLFKRYGNGASVDFSEREEAGENTYEYPIETSNPLGLLNLRNIFRTYGSKDSIYTADIEISSNLYLIVRYND